MLEVTVSINREVMVAQIHAVRISPKTNKVKDGTICTYDIMFNNVKVDTMRGDYGCGVGLAIQMLRQYDEVKYTLIYLEKMEV